MADGSGERYDWRFWLATAGALVLGGVLLVAAWAKALDPITFAEQIRVEGLEILLPAEALAILVVVAEVALGAALVLGIRRGWVLVPTAAMVAFFVFLTARTYWRFTQGIVDETAACGCFGNLFSRTPAEAFWQDLFLLVPPLLAAFLARPGSSRGLRYRVALTVSAAVGAGLLAWRAPELPLDDLATRLKPGVEMSAICAGRDSVDSVRICLDAMMPELEVGRHLIVIATLDNEELFAGIDRLNERAMAAGPTLWLLTDSLEEERQAFFWEWGPAFEIREAPLAMLRPLYRRQPRSFLVESGRVVETWPGLPPPAGAAEVAASPGG